MANKAALRVKTADGKWTQIPALIAVQKVSTEGGEGISYKIGHGLKVTNGDTLEVDAADKVEEDNTRPVTSAAVYTEVGNINALLATI